MAALVVAAVVAAVSGRSRPDGAAPTTAAPLGTTIAATTTSLTTTVTSATTSQTAAAPAATAAASTSNETSRSIAQIAPIAPTSTVATTIETATSTAVASEPTTSSTSAPIPPTTPITRIAPEAAAAIANVMTMTSVPADAIVPTSDASLEAVTNPINGRRGPSRSTSAGLGCEIDPTAARACLVATLDALGFNVGGEPGLDLDRRIVESITVVQLDAGLAANGVADQALYTYLGIWPGTAALGAAEVRTIGTSQEGRPLVARRYGNGAKVVLVVAQTHGDEEAGLRVMLRAVHQSLPAGETLWIVPTMNPDGVAHDTRFLANHHDPNRAAPVEPEQRAVYDFALAIHPTLAVYYHQNYGWIGGSGASMERARAYQSATKLGTLKRSGDCKLGFMWCPIDDALGSNSILVELPDIATAADIHAHAAALLAVAAA